MKKIHIVSIISVLSILGGIILSPGINNSAKAQTANLEYFLVADKAAIAPGDTFNVDIKIKNVSSGNPVKTAGVEIDFDSSKLEIVDADTTITGLQIKKTTTFPLIVENTVTSGTINYTVGSTTNVPTNNVVIGTIPFKVKSTASAGLSTLSFDSLNNNTSIYGTDGTTNLLSVATNLDVVISNIGMKITPATDTLNLGDEITLTFEIDNPNAQEIISAGMKVDFDDDVFEFKPTSSSQPTKMDTTTMSFELLVENDVSSGQIKFTAGSPGTSPETGTTLTLAKATFEVKSNAAEGISNFTFNTTDTIIYVKNDVVNNRVAKITNGTYTIGADDTKPKVRATPGGGTFDEPIEVELEVTNFDQDEVTIYYTLDGDKPTDNDDKYHSRIDIDEDTTLRFFAIVDATDVESDFEREEYIIRTTTPTPTPTGGTIVGRVFIVKSELTVELDNLVPITVEDTEGNPIVDGTQVSLRVTSDGFDKTYVGTTSGGIATIIIPGTDLKRGKTYTLIATSGGISSQPVVITIPLALRSAPTKQPGTGPAETLGITLLLLSGGLVYIYEKKKRRENIKW